MNGGAGPRQDHIYVVLFRNLFLKIPYSLAAFVLNMAGYVRVDSVRYMIIGATGLFYFLLYVTLIFAPAFWQPIFNASSELDPLYRTLLNAGLYYLFYLVTMLPVFLVLYHSKGKKEELPDKLPEPAVNLTEDWMWKQRERCGKKRTFLGGSFRNGKPVYLTDDMRVMHTQVVGSTGSGKTESVLLPMIAHDVRAGKGAIIIDGKGDLDFRNKLWWIMKYNGRAKDFRVFSLSNPGDSHSYNPLIGGNATEIKDKLIGSTVWTEEFFKKKAEEALLKLLRPMIADDAPKDKKKSDNVKAHDAVVCFSTLYNYLTDRAQLDLFKQNVRNHQMRADLSEMLKGFGNNHKYLAGIIADLALIARSEFGSLLETDAPEIKLLDAYRNNQVIYFQLNIQGYEETARRLGRLILQDIKTVSNTIQAEFRPMQRHFMGVFIDEFGSFANENFIDFLNKARGAGFAVTMLHQSLGDLMPQSKKNSGFQQQVIENTNLKIVLRQDDPQSVDRFARIAGTKPALISTYQTAERLFGTGFTGEGSLREAQAFHIEPDLIRTLKVGEAVFIRKHPEFHVDYLKLDFFDHPGEIPPFDIAETREDKTNETTSADSKSDKAQAVETLTQPTILGAHMRSAKPMQATSPLIGDRNILDHTLEVLKRKKFGK